MVATKARGKGKAAPVSVPEGCNRLMSRKQVCAALGGVSDRMLDKLMTSERFPKPTQYVGDLPRWSVLAFNAWVDREAAGQGGGGDGVGEQN